VKAVADPKTDNSDSSSSSASSSSSDSPDTEQAAKKPTVTKKNASDPSKSNSSSELNIGAKKVECEPVSAPTKDKDIERDQPTKKRRTGIDGSAVVTATEVAPNSFGRKANNERASVNERFKRVDPNKVEPIADNRYVAKVR